MFNLQGMFFAATHASGTKVFVKATSVKFPFIIRFV